MKISPVNMETRKNLDMKAGDTVRVHQKIEDKGGKTRIQVFEGMVLARKHGNEAGATFTVRRLSDGYGVEKVFPLYSPNIDKIEVVKRSKTKRSKLYHVRESAIKQIRKRMKMMFVDIKTEDDVPEEEASAEEPATEEAPVEEAKEETPAEEEKKEEAPSEEPKEEEKTEE